MISFSNVSFAYAPGASVRDISFEIGRGEFAALIGSNGAGKTTVSKLTAGILKPARGTVTVAGYDTRHTRTSVLAAHVGFLFQNPDRQICRPTVRQEVAFSLELAGRRDGMDARVQQVLEQFGLPGDAEPFGLSRGERQRVALAALLAAQPEILVLDEPTTGLDYRACMQMMDTVRQLNQAGTTVLMVCHDMEIVQEFAGRVLAMTDGRIVGDAAPHALFRQKDVLAAAHLLPPQIVQLGAELGGPFEAADTVEQMADAIGEEVRHGRRA